MTVKRRVMRCQGYVVRWPPDGQLYSWVGSEGWYVRMAGTAVWTFPTRAEARIFARQKP